MGLLNFFKRHPHAIGMILFFFLGLISYQFIAIEYGVVTDSQTQLGNDYQEYMLFMMIPVLCLASIPFILGLWFGKRRYSKQELFLGGDIVDYPLDERDVPFAD